MTKGDLIDAIATKQGITKTKAGDMIKAVVDAIADNLATGDGKVVIQGFGTFEVKATKGKSGVSPGTGKPYTSAPSRRVGFKAGKELKEAVKARA